MLAVSVVIGATLLAVRAVSRRESPVVRDIVRAPVIQVPAPVVDVPEPVVQVIPQADSSAQESMLRRIAGVLALLGIITYVYLMVVYDRFYSVLHVDPADVGLGYASTLSRSSGLIVIVVAIIGFVLFSSDGS
jgi:hypothetical protein